MLKFNALLSVLLFFSLGVSAQKRTFSKADTVLAFKYWRIGEQKYDASRFDSAALCYKKAADLYEKNKLWAKFVDAKRSEGLCYIDKGEYELALAITEKALSVSNKYLGKNHTESAACVHNIALIYMGTSDYEQSLEFFKRSLIVYKKKYGENHRYVALIYNNMAQVFDYTADYKEAISYYKKALKIRLKTLGKQHLDVAGSYNNIALTLNNMGQYDTAVAYYRRSLAIFAANKIVKSPDLSMIYNNIALALEDMNDYTESLKYYNMALEMRKEIYGEQHEVVGESYSNIGNHYDLKGEYEQAIEYRTRALHIILKALGEKHWLTATIYSNMSNSYNSKGEHDKALEFQLKAASINREIFGEIHPDMAMVYNNIGNSYQHQERYTESLEYYHKAKPIYEETLGKKHKDVSMVLNNIGLIHDSRGNYDEALKFQRESLKIALEIFGTNHKDVAMPVENLAMIFRNKEMYDSALVYSAWAASIYRDRVGERTPDLASCYGIAAETYTSLKKYDLALRYYHKSLIANHHSFSDTNIYSVPPAEGYFQSNIMLELLISKAALLEEIYKENKQPKYLDVAIAHLQTADTLLGQVRKTISSTTDKLQLNQKTNQLCEVAVRVYLEQAQATQNKQSLQNAICFVENNHAAVLREAISESKAKTFAGLPADVLAKEIRLKKRLDWFAQQKVENASDKKAMAIINDSIFAYHRMYDQHVAYIEKNNKAYYQLKYQDNLPTVAQLQAKLPSNSATLSYFWADDKVYLAIVTPKNYTLLPLPTDSLSAREVRAMRNGIIFKENEVYIEAAQILFKQLIAPAEQFFAQHKEKPTQLFIIPDGVLSYIPFEALLTKNIEPKSIENSQKWPFLLQKYTVSYFYSTTLLLENLNVPSEKTPNRYMAMAPVFSEGSQTNFVVKSCERFFDAYRRSDTTKTAAGEDVTRAFTRDGRFISPIPATETEVRQIAGNFQSKNAFAKYFLFRDAREELLKSDSLGQYNYLHLATHGFVNENRPELSGLLLSQDSTSKEDGILYSGEIYNLRLKAELVTLSACETGLGKIVKGEGVVGLTRSFLYAGAKNVMVSLWKVSDNSTSKLMVDFYNEMFDGHNKSKSLQQSKQKLIKSGNYSLPYYWAPFVLVGHQ